MTDDEKARELLKKWDALKQVRTPYEAPIDNIIRFVNHGRRLIADTPEMRGRKTGTDVYDGTAVSAKNLLVDGMCGYMCSRSLRWFSLTIPHRTNFPRSSSLRQWSDKRVDSMPEVRRWLDDVADVMYAAFDYGNFYDILPEFVGDGATVGTVTLMSDEDVDLGKTIYTVPHFRECWIAENQYGMVDTLFRECNYTLKQLRDKFGEEAMKGADPSFTLKYNQNPYTEASVLRAIFPRKDRLYGSELGKDKPIASVWILRSPVALLLDSGTDGPPFVTWRWRKNADEPYGRSPAWDAYVEIVLANQQGKTNLIAAQKMAEPPMVGPDDLRSSVRSGPGGWTWVQNMERQQPKPLLTGMQLPFAVEAQDRTASAIKEHFHVNFFLMLYQAAFNKVDLTATQVLGMQGEQAAVLGTRVGRLESEGFDPIIDRQFSIEYRAGRIPEPPDVLMESGGRIRVEYLGPLAQAQRRLHKTRGIQAGIQLVSELVNIAPQSGDKVDWDVTVEEALDAAGFPTKCLRDPESVARIRAMRAKQQEAAMQADLMVKGAKAASLAGKGADPNSLMGKMMEQGGEGGGATA